MIKIKSITKLCTFFYVLFYKHIFTIIHFIIKILQKLYIQEKITATLKFKSIIQKETPLNKTKDEY